MVQILTITWLAFSLFVIHMFVIYIILTCPTTTYFFVCLFFNFLFGCFEISSNKAKNKKKSRMTKINRSGSEMWDIFTAMDTRFWASDWTIGSMSSPFASGPFQMGKWVVNERNMPLWRCSNAAVFFLSITPSAVLLVWSGNGKWML